MDFWADDSYCIAQGCPCRDAVIAFFQTGSDLMEPLCSIRVDLDHLTIRSAETKGPPTDQQIRLWSDLQRDAPHACAELKTRFEVMHRIAPEIRALAKGTSRVVSPRGQRPGRNDPCPCGSGRKYKKCCLGNEPSVT